jgi:hypothetical protein
VSRRKGLVPRRPLKTTDASLPARLQQEQPAALGASAEPAPWREALAKTSPMIALAAE